LISFFYEELDQHAGKKRRTYPLVPLKKGVQKSSQVVEQT